MAAVYFPPYVLKDEPYRNQGILTELVRELNKAQKEFQFVIVPTSLNRRFRDFEQRRVDLCLFETPQWGWDRIAHRRIDMGIEDEEVFVARREVGRGQEYFNRLAGKRLVLFASYHYQFAGFNTDAEYLAREFNAVLGHSHESNLLMVLRHRADIALMTRSFMDAFIKRNPLYANELLISERVDQIYRHQAVLHPQAAINAEQFSAVYEKLRSNGTLSKVFAGYTIKVLPADKVERISR